MFYQRQKNYSCHDWYSTQVGNAVLEVERMAIENLPVKLFGHYLLQVDGPNDFDFSNLSGVRKKIYLHNEFSHLPAKYCDYSVCGDFTDLPFLPGSIDIAFIFHALEFAKQPYQVLQEFTDILVPEGYLLIFGFNPYSLFGIKHFFSADSNSLWQGKYINMRCLERWLKELGFIIVHKQTMFFLPPFKSKKMLKKFLFLEGFGSMFCPSLGGVSMILAQKKEMGLMPLKHSVLQRILPVMASAHSYVKPTARITDN